MGLGDIIIIGDGAKLVSVALTPLRPGLEGIGVVDLMTP
jgi:hypothetical protein